MAKQTSYKHGQFSWAELATQDAAAAKRFYGALFGWSYTDMPAGPGMTYTLCKKGDQDVCGLFELGSTMPGMPPCWSAFITVDSVDERTRLAAKHGGKVLREPMDVMDVGRMSVIQDPTGAALSLWQAKKHLGAGVMGEPGALTWTELFTSNPDVAGKFYISTLGWKAQSMDMGPEMGTYTLFGWEGDSKNAGGMLAIPKSMQGVPSTWLVYFDVADCDASTRKANELGARTIVPPTQIPQVGRFSILQDPQGAVVALFKQEH